MVTKRRVGEKGVGGGGVGDKRDGRDLQREKTGEKGMNLTPVNH